MVYKVGTIPPFIEKICSDSPGRLFQSELDTEFLPEDGKSFRSVTRRRGQSFMLIHDQETVIWHLASPALKSRRDSTASRDARSLPFKPMSIG